MARLPRNTLPTRGVFHLCSRGVERRAIYLDDTDRLFFLALYRHAVARHRWDVLAYCLMTNHFHIVVDAELGAVQSGMHLLKSRYGQAFNHRYTRSGHLFQGRFYSGHVEPEAVGKVCDYVLDNPVRARLCTDRGQWPWLGGRTYADA